MSHSSSTQLNKAITDRYLALPRADGSIQAEYVWIGGSGEDVRSKGRTLPRPVTSVDELPEWNFDGSSTGQAPGHDSEVILRPQAIFRDPFRPAGGNNILVMCDCYTPQGEAIPTNTRAPAAALFNQNLESEPWFGLEQEYTLMTLKKWPFGWPHHAYPGAQGPYYCSAGANVAFGRDIVESHYNACLYAGVKIAGINGEVMPGQWEYQIGPCEGIQSGDHCWMARYIMHRVCEEFGVVCSFDPKPIQEGDWNGAGCHTNYSTKAMREEGGFAEIRAAIEKMASKHMDHIQVYGRDNHLRLTGKHETAPMNKFTFGVANRGASVRIPRQTEREGKGYFEDRRPASCVDPYVVTGKIFETTVIED